MRDVRRGARLVGLLGAMLASIALLAPPVAAAEAVTLTTTYPGVAVDPGGEAALPLVVTTPTPERVDLEVVESPEGFETSFRGGGFTVSSVFTTDAETPPELELVVEVPEDATPADHTIRLRASAPPATADLVVDVTVSDASAGDVTLTTDFPALRGDTEQTFSFDLTLTNDTAQEITFGLEAVGPPGWEVTAQPAGEAQASTAVVPPGDQQSVSVEVTPDVDAEAGVYDIPVRASGGSQTAETLLQVELTGITSLALEPADPSGRVNTSVTAGSTTTYQLLVTNTGTAPLADVAITPTPPRDWEVTFDVETIPALAPQEQQLVTATIRPAEGSVAGDYEIEFAASAMAPGAESGSVAAEETVTLRTTVETSSVWGFVGLALIAVVVVGLLLVFRQFGRR